MKYNNQVTSIPYSREEMDRLLLKLHDLEKKAEENKQWIEWTKKEIEVKIAANIYAVQALLTSNTMEESQEKYKKMIDKSKIFNRNEF